MIIQGRVVDGETGELRIGISPPIVILVNIGDLTNMIAKCRTLIAAIHDAAGVTVDLERLTRLPEGPLTPVVKWATAELLSGNVTADGTRTIPTEALNTLADLCGLDLPALLDEITTIHQQEQPAE